MLSHNLTSFRYIKESWRMAAQCVVCRLGVKHPHAPIFLFANSFQGYWLLRGFNCRINMRAGWKKHSCRCALLKGWERRQDSLAIASIVTVLANAVSQQAALGPKRSRGVSVTATLAWVLCTFQLLPVNEPVALADWCPHYNDQKLPVCMSCW